jgi:predicted porin
MKKILLGTTALVGAALIAGAAFAGEDPKVTVGGFSTFEGAWKSDDRDSHDNSVTFRNDNEIHFNVAGKSDMGLGYGAEIDLIADVDGGQSGIAGATGAAGYSNAGIVARRTYGWLQGDQWGHIEFGSNDGVDTTLKVDASNIARATGGINGDWRYFANTNSPNPAPAGLTNATAAAAAAAQASNGAFAGGRQFITSANLPIANGSPLGFYNDAYTNDTKITYYTPRFAGFQAGVSYTPSLVDRGENSNALVNVVPGTINGSNIWTGGLNYESQFDQVGVAAAATGELGHADNSFVGASGLNDLKAWNVGAKVSFLGWSLAGSYGDWDNSFNTSGTTAWYATGGLAYETGPFGASVTYSEDKAGGTGFDDKFQNASVGVDYKLAPGLTPFIEYSWIDVDGSGGTFASGNTEAKSNVVIIGSQLSF